MLFGILVFPDLLATTYFSDPKVVLPGMVVIAVGSTVIPLNRTGISLVRFCKFFFFFLRFLAFSWKLTLGSQKLQK